MYLPQSEQLQKAESNCGVCDNDAEGNLIEIGLCRQVAEAGDARLAHGAGKNLGLRTLDPGGFEIADGLKGIEIGCAHCGLYGGSPSYHKCKRLNFKGGDAPYRENAAYVFGLKHEIGSIRAGKKADFAVLEADPFETPPGDLKDIPVWGTVFEGEPAPLG